MPRYNKTVKCESASQIPQMTKTPPREKGYENLQDDEVRNVPLSEVVWKSRKGDVTMTTTS